MTVGLIGYGRFGAFAARHIAARCRLVIHDSGTPARRRLPRGARRGSFAEAAAQEIVILAVPVSALRPVLRELRRTVRPGAMVIDVCAVKEEPVRWMKQILPESVDILGTHPLFGPDSAARTLRAKTVVLCPVRLSRERLRRVVARLAREGLKTLILTPREHDSLMAETIFLTQFIGRLVAGSALRRRPPVTRNYANLLQLVETVRQDTTELFVDMVAHSRESRRVMKSLGRAFALIQRSMRGRRR